MKEKILKSIFFILILLILLVILSQIVTPKNNSKDFGMLNATANGILGEKENSIDVLIVGDSEAYSSFIPMKLWEDYGITSYVCSTPKQTLPDSLMYTYKATKKQKPKILILEANNVLNRVSLSEPFIKVINDILPITEYHTRWKSLTKNDFFKKKKYTWKDQNKGYNESENIEIADSSNYMKYSDDTNKVPRSNGMYVKLLKKLCDEKDIELIIVSTPSTINWNYPSHNGIKQFAEKENIEFVDLNLIADELEIDWSKDSRDKGDHLNNSGALKVTKHMGKYLKGKNKIKKHKEDSYYNN